MDLTSKFDVVVIGGGMFGAEIALRARAAGLVVSIVEAKPDLLLGASANNQNRLHLGFHYPRDLETGLQSIRGFNDFSSKYHECIEGNFPNAYFVAEKGSLTTPEDFLAFCGRLGATFTPIGPSDMPIKVEGVTTGVLCQESVYDFVALRRTVWARLQEAGIPVLLNARVDSIRHDVSGYTLGIEGKGNISARSVVNATYADVNRLTEQLGFMVQERQFEYTVVPIVSLPVPKVGITIMDGPFVTLLPYGRTGDFLLYSVEHTVVAREIATQMQTSWIRPETSPLSGVDKMKLGEQTLKLASRFLPVLREATIKGFLEGPRIVLARRESTDARPSIINKFGDGYFTVFAGKIDHCMWVADEISGSLLEILN
jgi:glycine/D-amino acid oxidase-like deaminating enzyme